MAPRFVDSWPDRKRPSYLQVPLPTVDTFLKGAQKDDGAEGFWRIHDGLYDLTSWVDVHPGGAQWLQLTKGTDITEAFECHHISPRAESLLPQYFVRKAATARSSPYTFHKAGFYRTLKAEVWNSLGPKSHKFHPRTILYIDSLATFFLASVALAAMYNSLLLALVAGLSLTLLTVMAHNFFHRRDNWRMYYFHLSFLSVRDWRISHALSHHLFTNTDKDLEMLLLYPFFDWFPHNRKSWFHVHLSPIYGPVTYPFIWFSQILTRLILKTVTPADVICLVIPSLLYICSSQGLPQVFLLWVVIMGSGSFLFAFIGLNAAHHHPEIFHQGDSPREDRDWGLNQIDAVRSRPDERNQFIVLTTFGEHTLHHLFPTVDHCYLPAAHEAFHRVCKQFNIKLDTKTGLQLFKGQLQQLSRTIPNDKLKHIK